MKRLEKQVDAEMPISSDKDPKNEKRDKLD